MKKGAVGWGWKIAGVLLIVLVSFVVLLYFIAPNLLGIERSLEGPSNLAISNLELIPCEKAPIPDAGENILVCREDFYTAWVPKPESTGKCSKTLEAGANSFEINFTANETTSSCLEPVTVSWDFGDGSYSESMECNYTDLKKDCGNVDHTYAFEFGKTYEAKLMVTGERSGYVTEDYILIHTQDPQFGMSFYEEDHWTIYRPGSGVEIRGVLVYVKGKTKEGNEKGIVGLRKEDFKLSEFSKPKHDLEVNDLSKLPYGAKGAYFLIYSSEFTTYQALAYTVDVKVTRNMQSITKSIRKHSIPDNLGDAERELYLTDTQQEKYPN